LTTILTFAGNTDAGAEVPWSADVLYGIHISNDDTNTDAEENIWIQFGVTDDGDWGVSVVGLPGSTDEIIGATGEGLEDGNAKVWAGLKDDPFFMDFAGLIGVFTAGNLDAYTGDDFFATKNARAIVLETNLDDVVDGDNPLHIWATTQVAATK
jgi:hypothetical protein